MRILRPATVAFFTLILFGALSSTASARDRNSDGIPDSWETHQGLSLDVNQANGNPDHDGLTNLGEYRSHTKAQSDDSNHNGVEDGDEDRDRDGVDNSNEMREGTNPLKRDSNRNGVKDGQEDADDDGLSNAGEDHSGNDPIDPDSDDDGIADGDEVVGTIGSFTDGVLTIDLAGGGTLTGTVNDQTEIKCETEAEDEVHNGADDPADGSDDGTDDGTDDGGNDLDDPDEIGDADNICTTADLLPGTAVHEADIENTSAGAVFEEIELVK
jgi:hypothetical protein